MKNLKLPAAILAVLLGVFLGTDVGAYKDSPVPPLAGGTSWGLGLPKALLPVNQVMASPPTVTAAETSPTLAKHWTADFQQQTLLQLTGQNFTYANTNEQTNATFGMSVAGGIGIRGPQHIAFEWVGQNIELGYTGHATEGTGDQINMLVKFDNQYVTLTPQVAPNTSNTYYNLYQFASRGPHRIDIIGMSGYWPGIYTDASDTVMPAELRGPQGIMIGDSLTGGAGGNYGVTDSWVQIMQDALGWDNVINYGIGGGGYSSGAANQPCNSFLADSTYNNISFDIIGVALGRNDNLTATTTVAAAASSCFAGIKAKYPNATLVVFGPFWNGGPYTYNATNNAYPNDLAIKAAALQYTPYYSDWLIQPIPKWIGPMSRTISSGISSGGNTFSITIQTIPVFPFPAALQIDSEIVEAVSASFSTYTIDGTFHNNHSNGAPVALLGFPLWTGHGYVSNTQAYGNSNLLSYSDNVHWTSEGHLVTGIWAAKQMKHMFQNEGDYWQQAN